MNTLARVTKTILSFVRFVLAGVRMNISSENPRSINLGRGFFVINLNPLDMSDIKKKKTRHIPGNDAPLSWGTIYSLLRDSRTPYCLRRHHV